MSQSPLSASQPGNTDRYLQGWKALNRLLHEDRSFSGHERNCAFLNTGKGRFADVSAPCGFDQIDDGRAIAVSDWDGDGDLDLWIANRTAPRIRFLRNNTDQVGRSISFRLRGDGVGTSRDAIGARVELKTGSRTLIKTLRAGDGFISQSSKLIHFGLGKDENIQQAVVRWPGGKAETIAGLKSGHRYVINQGGGIAKPLADQPRPIASSDPVVIPTSSDASRVVLTSRVPFPPLAYQDANDQRIELARTKGPLIINLWASWCAPCVKEMTEWCEQEEVINQKNLAIVALSVDEPDTQAAARSLLKRLDFPFRSGFAGNDTLESIDAIRRAILDRWKTLAIPTSLLIDDQGRIAVIYRGAVELDQLLSDVELLKADQSRILAASTPFEGQWHNRPGKITPISVASQFLDAARVDDAIAYLREATSRPTLYTPNELGDIYYNLGLFLSQRDPTKAVEAWDTATRVSPTDVRVRAALGDLLWKMRKDEQAAEEFTATLKINPRDQITRRKLGQVRLGQKRFADAIRELSLVLKTQARDATLLVDLAGAYLGQGKTKQACEHYRKSLAIAPNMPKSLNNLTWILATHPDSSLRSADEAVTLGERLGRLSGRRHPQVLDTLAAAYAEAGRFDEAKRNIVQAIELAKKAGDLRQSEILRKRLDLYMKGQPFRDHTLR